MPGYDTHYLFGVHTYRRMPDSAIKNNISRFQSPYKLGILGPDIFFYYATEVVAARKNIGSTMHTSKTDIFFKKCIEYAISQEDEAGIICISYISGFLTHYTLDCLVHPYVYWMTDYNHKTKDYLEKHFSLETDIDIMLLRTYLDTTPREFFSRSEVSLSSQEMNVICSLLHYAIRHTYHDSRITKRGIKMAILSLQKEHKLLKLFSSKAKNAIGTIEYAFVGQRYIAPLIPGGDEVKHLDPLNLSHHIWFNPWDLNISSTESVPQLLNRARDRYLLTIFLLDNFLEDTSNNKAFALLLNKIGSKSYHSGLNCRIPS